MARKDPLALDEWLVQNRFHHSSFTLEQLAESVKAQSLSVTVIVPARNVADTVGNVLDITVKPLVDAKIVSSVVAVVCDPTDPTGDVAAAHGARIVQRQTIAPELGPSLGKGDAMWRALQATSGDIIAFLDGDTEDPSPAHLMGIVAPLILKPTIKMVRACFARPFKMGNGETKENDGGRVTELCARPLLNLHWPQLSGFSQPLAGEFAARRSLLEELSFPVGYGIEIGTLIDTFKLEGLEALAECDVGSRQNQHKALRDLTPMSFSVLCALEKRLERNTVINEKLYLPWSNSTSTVATVERPPLSQYKKAVMHRFGSAPERPPFIAIDGIENFRDVGTASLYDVDSISRGMVYRCAALSQLSACGKARLQQLGIGAVFDTRSSIELNKSAHLHGGVSEEEAATWEQQYKEWTAEKGGPRYFHVPILNDSDFSNSVNAVRVSNYAKSDAEGFAEAYVLLISQSGPCMRTILEYLAQNPQQPILIHCTAGKDRTGVVVMLLLLLAGCQPELIADEYSLSEIGLHAWRQKTIDRLMTNDHPALKGNRQACHNMTSAKRENMLAAISAFHSEWNDVAHWAVSSAGIPVDVVEQATRALQAR